MKARFLTNAFALAALFATFLVVAQAGAQPKPVTPAKPDTSAQSRDDLIAQEQQLKRQFEEFGQQLLRLKQRLERSDAKEDQARAKVLAGILEHVNNKKLDLEFERLIEIIREGKLSNTNDLREMSERSEKLADQLRELIRMFQEDPRAKAATEERKKLAEWLKQVEKIINDQKQAQGLTENNKTDPKELAKIQKKVTEKTGKLADDMKKHLDGKGGEAKNEKGDNKDGGKGEGAKGEAKDGGENAKGKDDKGESKDAGKGSESAKAGDKGEAKGDKSGEDKKGGEGAEASAKSGGKEGSEGAEAGAKDKKGGKEGAEGSQAKSGNKDAKGMEGGAKDSGNKSGDPKEAGPQASAKGGEKSSQGSQGEKSGKPGEGAKPSAKAGGDKGSEAKSGSKDAKGSEGGKGSEAKSGGKEGSKGSKGSKGEAKSGSQSQGQSQAKSSGQKSPEGQPQGGEQSAQQKGDPNQGQPQPPPQGGNKKPDDVAKAQKKLKEAGYDEQSAEKNIAKSKTPDAVKDQGKAIDKLQEVKENLEKLLRQKREEEMERLLAALKARCEKMLRMQMEVLAGTESTHKGILANADKKPAELQRKDSLKLSDSEKDIINEANRAIQMLEEEGSAVAFPEVFHQVREDMKHVQRRLELTDVGDQTQTIERSIIDSLKEMIEALKKAQQELEQSKNPPPPMPGQPPPNADQKLLDQIAELKMIRSLQKRVNDRTKLYQGVDGEQTNDQTLRRELRDLSIRQERIFEITNRLAKGDNR